GKGDCERAEEHGSKEKSRGDSQDTRKGRIEARAEYREREEENEQRTSHANDERRKDDAEDVLGPCEGAHEDLFEHSVLPVEPELSPCVCASVDDRQRHGASGEEQRVADHPTVPDFERWYDPVQPKPLHEDEEEREDQLEKQRRPVEIRSQIAIDESQVDVHPKSPSRSPDRPRRR